MTLNHYQRDPAYGSGVYRRLIKFIPGDGLVVATVNDTHHSLWLTLDHHAGRIVDVEGRLERYPATSCGGAGEGLRALIGTSLEPTAQDISSRLPVTANCTHLGDLVQWAISAARRQAPPSSYLISVPDSLGGPVWISISMNGEVVHRWLVKDHAIVAPEPLAGKPLLRGFFAWARSVFDEADLEAAVMLQRGAWVARGRPFVVDQKIHPLSDAAGMHGVCFSYSGANWAQATNMLGYVRDFTSGVVEHPLPARIAQRLASLDC